MRCEELESVLALDDVDARIDQRAAADHLACCDECAGRWPEVAALVGVVDVPASQTHDGRARTRQRRAAIAASLVALLAVGVTIGARTGDRHETRIAPPVSEPTFPLPRRAVESSSQETIRFDRGRRFESQITYAVWTAPTPKCLRLGGSGS